MPSLLQARWHEALLPVVSAWAGGVELEPTALYGMRVYREGSWLTRHVDREDTHALSAIMNLDQAADVQPWPLVIDSIAGVPLPPYLPLHHRYTYHYMTRSQARHAWA